MKSSIKLYSRKYHISLLLVCGSLSITNCFCWFELLSLVFCITNYINNCGVNLKLCIFSSSREELRFLLARVTNNLRSALPDRLKWFKSWALDFQRTGPFPVHLYLQDAFLICVLNAIFLPLASWISWKLCSVSYLWTASSRGDKRWHSDFHVLPHLGLLILHCIGHWCFQQKTCWKWNLLNKIYILFCSVVVVGELVQIT